METIENTHNSDNCANIEIALDIIVGKWQPIILFHLINNEKLRFSEFQRAIPNISKKVLTNQLRELERHDIVHRKVYAEVPPRVEYSMTEYGMNLKTVLLSMHTWGLEHLQHLKELHGGSK
ncbi:winged helix-turn-helix transcriptional regulator [Peribacillus sp. NPDC097264]|uniref:winged helix-turn-helix transcriptional regulator n=1 Tax=Peribacillus sp. NPDC097264 TaxID=3390616 RepID=UPI003CFE87D3